MNISVSEINSFLRCRQAWDYGSANRKGLRHKSDAKLFLTVGSAIHVGLEARFYGQDPFTALNAYLDEELEKKKAAYLEEHGFSVWDSELAKFRESAELAHALLGQYLDHYGHDNPYKDMGLKEVAVEVPFSIPLLDNGTTDEPTNFVGTIDTVLVDIETETNVYLGDNKSKARATPLDGTEVSNQFLGYCWAFRELTGVKPVGMVYNGIIKALIGTPKVLKSGKLSVDKSARVTYASFLKAVQEGEHDPADYVDYMEYLFLREQDGDTRFFQRDTFYYTDFQLDDWYARVLGPVVSDMEDDPVVYLNRTSCEGCFFRDLCDAESRDEDVLGLLDLRYKKGTYGTMETVRTATPQSVGSVDELLALLDG